MGLEPFTRRGAPRHRVAVTEATLCWDLLDYLRSGGWVADAVEDSELSVRWADGETPGKDRVNLTFSVAVWRAMNGYPDVDVEFAELR